MTTPPPFDTVGDEPLEARIVAWVLGDASAFEAAELERLCDERPELLVFRRRMRALHGLLTEAEAREPDQAWKLLPEKRRVIDEIFGVSGPAVRPVPQRTVRARRPWRRTILAIAAGLILMAAIGWLVAPQLMPMRKNTLAAHQGQSSGSPAAEAAIQELRKAVRAQEDAVEEKRKLLSAIVRDKGIVYNGPDAYYSSAGRADDDGARSTLDSFKQVETEKQQLESQIQGLLKYSDDQLMTYASGLQVPDNSLPTLYPKYLETKTELEKLKRQGLAGQDPALLERQQTADTMKKQLDEGVVALRNTLQAKLELAEARYKRALSTKNEKRTDAIKRGLDAQDYVDAKREFEAEQEMLQRMKLKLIEGEISSKMSDARVPLMTAFRDAIESKSVPLTTELPPEMIEGTPKPIILPGLAQVPAKASAERNFSLSREAEAKSAAAAAKPKAAPDLAANPKRVAAAGAAANVPLPEPSDHFGEMSGLSSLDGGRSGIKSGAVGGGSGMGGSGKGVGFGYGGDVAGKSSGAVASSDSRRRPTAAPRAVPPPPAAVTPAPPSEPMSAAQDGLSKAGIGTGAFTEAPRLEESSVEESSKVLGSISLARDDKDPGHDQRSGGEADLGARRALDTSALSGRGEKRNEAIKRGLDAQDYGDAKLAFDAEQKKLQQVSKDLAGAEVADRMPKHELAARADPASELMDGKDANKLAGVSRGAVPASGPAAALATGRPAPSADPFSDEKPGGHADGRLAARSEIENAELRGFEGHTEHGAPVTPPQDRNGQALTEGMRSGDAVVSRNSIDALIDRSASTHAGTLSLDATAGNHEDVSKKLEAAAPVDSIRTNLAAAADPGKNVEAVRRGLYTAEGNYNLGKYDAAKAEYEKVLRTDPYNQAARRGLESIASAKSSYYRAAYDQTRSELLMEVDKAWELSASADSPTNAESKSTAAIIRDFDARSNVPPPATTTPTGTTPAPDAKTAPPPPAKPAAPLPERPKAAEEVVTPLVETPALADGDDDYAGTTTVGGGTLEWGEGRLKNKAAEGEKSDQLVGLAQREMLRRQSVVAASDGFLTDARDAYGKRDYQRAYAGFEKGLAVLPDAPATKARREALRQHLGDAAVALADQAVTGGRNDEAKGWLAKALEWDPGNQQAHRQLVLDAGSESRAADAPFTTISLSISEASFKMAQAAMARGERPDPSGIKVEQFYNAVDYGDPAPSSSEPVAGWVEQAAHPVIPGRNLVRVAMRTGAAGRSAAQPLRLTLLVDQSGSMAREDRRAAMDNALKQLGGLLTKQDLVTVIGFSRTPRLLVDALTGEQAAKLNNLVNQAASEGGTNLEEAMKLGEQMALRQQTAGAQNRLVLFTDGAANLGNADPSRLAERVKAMRQKGLAFDIAGIGTNDLNDRLLGELARHGNGRYYVVDGARDGGFARQLAGAFRPAAENVKVQVRFNPQRVGRYKLLGFEAHRLNTEDFRNDAVDAAELAAEEAGVALYQVEPLAEGSGEIGEVSVRFRDAASGQMVERSWTIPYEATAPAFDRSAPSMQLAGLALLAAEKLRGGPLAEAIDFRQLAAPRATVKQYYSNSRRVAEMLEMVDKL
ncbi:MAG: von Willebrand factor type A domain-containing protein [Verrucomicrobia bacterium]|nr:von Willebrand factor type A domain-containing protein [Verrucomicrobiota bacterium]